MNSKHHHLIITLTALLLMQTVYASSPLYTIKNLEIGSECTHTESIPTALENLISGSGVALQYNAKINHRHHPLTTPQIVEKANKACNIPTQLRTPEEQLAYDIINKGLSALAQKIAHHFTNVAFNNYPIIFFGGLIENLDESFIASCEKKIRKALPPHKQTSLIRSKLNQERALIGAAKTILPKNPSSNTEKRYVLSLDIGGTNMRAGVVDISTNAICGKIKIAPVFVNNEQTLMMNLKKTTMHHALAYPSLNDIPNNVPLKQFLPNLHDITQHNMLQKSFIKRLCNLINQFDLNPISHIAIAIPGVITDNGYTKIAYNIPTTGINLCKKINQKIKNAPAVTLVGDVYAAAMGEAISGSENAMPRFFLLGIGTGINMCIIDTMNHA